MEWDPEDSLLGGTATFPVGEEVAEEYFKMQDRSAYILRILCLSNMRN